MTGIRHRWQPQTANIGVRGPAASYVVTLVAAAYDVSPVANQTALYGGPSTAASSRHLEPSAFLLHLEEAPWRLKTSRRKAELEPGTRRNQQDPSSHLYAPSSIFYDSKSRRLEVTTRRCRRRRRKSASSYFHLQSLTTIHSRHTRYHTRSSTYLAFFKAH
ncbi:hypothetical protein BC629DRAFT_1653460 [Irpex lacteus]|nr:hypothetical protein BC629DRAFT_1653460 [Irpex lacteus]